jgi:hypothetical protein
MQMYAQGGSATLGWHQPSFYDCARHLSQNKIRSSRSWAGHRKGHIGSRRRCHRSKGRVGSRRRCHSLEGHTEVIQRSQAGVTGRGQRSSGVKGREFIKFNPSPDSARLPGVPEPDVYTYSRGVLAEQTSTRGSFLS